MTVQNQSKSLPPPGLFSSLTAGFDAVTNHVIVLVLPIVLDLILWLGPRLRIQSMMQPVIASWAALSEEGLFGAEAVQQAQEIWEVAITRFNLFTLVNTFPVGMPSLVAGISPGDSPLGAGVAWQVESAAVLLGGWALVTLAGWALGGVYLYSVAHIALRSGQPGVPAPRSLWWMVAQSVVVMLFWTVLLAVLAIPGVFIIILVSLISPLLAQFVVLLLFIMAVWALIPVYFSSHGVFVYGQHAFASIMQSLKLIRFTMPATSLFLIIMFVIGQGLAYLWRTPQETSWFLVVGIAAHAFISTSLVAGGFIYYRDTNAWLQVMLERHKPQASSPSPQV